MSTQIFHCETGSIEYAIWGSGEQDILLLPAGVGRMSGLSPLIELLSKTHRVISINFPGIGQSFLQHPSISTIASAVESLLYSLDSKHPIVIGESYGGDVALRLLDSVPAKACVLLASGAYFSDIERNFLRILFLPSMRVPRIRRFYSFIIKRIHAVKFSGSEQMDLDQIAMRWWEILQYNLPNRIFYLPCAIFWPEKDGVLRKGTLEKLTIMFPYAHIMDVPSGHHNIFQTLEKNDFWQILDFIQKVEDDEKNKFPFSIVTRVQDVLHV